MLTWLTWLVLAPVSALAVVVDLSIPFFVTTAGTVATMLLLVPAALAVGNLGRTMQGRWTLLFGAGRSPRSPGRARLPVRRQSGGGDRRAAQRPRSRRRDRVGARRVSVGRLRRLHAGRLRNRRARLASHPAPGMGRRLPVGRPSCGWPSAAHRGRSGAHGRRLAEGSLLAQDALPRRSTRSSWSIGPSRSAASGWSPWPGWRCWPTCS